jgi:hypothetical protein
MFNNSNVQHSYILCFSINRRYLEQECNDDCDQAFDYKFESSHFMALPVKIVLLILVLEVLITLSPLIRCFPAIRRFAEKRRFLCVFSTFAVKRMFKKQISLALWGVLSTNTYLSGEKPWKSENWQAKQSYRQDQNGSR